MHFKHTLQFPIYGSGCRCLDVTKSKGVGHILVNIPESRHPNLAPGVLTYLGLVWRFCSDDPHFFYLLSNWGPFLWLTSILLAPSFYRKIGLPLLPLVPEILGPKASSNISPKCII